jgi:RHS repeat-associated protein
MLGRQRLAIEERVKSIATGTIKTTTRYLHGDRLGSTRLVTTDTHAFGPAWYSPYGVTQGSLPTRYAFAGQEAEAEVGLVQMGARYLDPALGRMVTPDPYRFRNRHLLNPKRDNMFAYGLNNPLNMVDPSGFDPITVTDATGTHEIGEGMTIVGQAPARSPQPTPIATPQAGPAPTAAGVTITGSPDLSSAWQLIMPPPTFPGFFRYDAHGGGGFVDVPKQYNPNTGAPIGTERHFTEKASTLARFIRSHREYQENMPVILNVCRAGAGWDNSIGQKLANEMGVRVLAPTGEVNVAGDIVGEGAWVSFEPQF